MQNIIKAPNLVDLVYPPEGTYNATNYYNLDVNLDGTDCLGICSYNKYVNSWTSTTDVPFRIGKPSIGATNHFIVKIRVDGGDTETYSIVIGHDDLYQICTLTNLSYGKHTIEFGVWLTASGATLVDTMDFPEEERLQFTVLPPWCVFQNQNGDMLYHFQNRVTAIGVNQPVLFVDGDDPVNNHSRFEYWTTHLNDVLAADPNLDLNSKDIYMLMFRDSRRDARLNAMSTLQAIQYVHNHITDSYPNAMIEGTIVAGFSLGGILSRYALAFAEEHNIQHFCSEYIAIDSPQRGASLNVNFQQSVEDMNSYLLAAGYAGFSHLGSDLNKALKATDIFKKGLTSDSAKQLIRTNKYAGASNSNQAYIDGTNECNRFFSEINVEDHWSNHSTVVLNSLSNPRPGFPYKQNNIKCVAISNGSLELSGVENGNDDIISWWLMVGSYTTHGEDYDKQPGSTFGFKSDDDIFPLNYDPVLVPTRSALYLKPASNSNPNNIDNQFLISNYNAFSFPSNVTTPEAKQEYIKDHSYFDEVMYKQPSSDPSWFWKHGLDDDYTNATASNVIARVLEWSSNPMNRATSIISGSVSNFDHSNITIKAYIGSYELVLGSDCDHVQSDGTFRVPYTLMNDADVKLVFIKSGYIPTTKHFHFDYNETHGTINSFPSANVSLFPFSYGNILVGQTNNVSFQTINDALSYIWGVVNGPDYDNSPIVIKVYRGEYPGTLYLHSDGHIPSLTLEGESDGVIIKGGDLNNSAINCFDIPYITLRNLTVTRFNENCNRGISLSGAIEMATVENCILTDCCSPGVGTVLSSNVPSVIRDCEIYGNHTSDDMGALFLNSVAADMTTIQNCKIHDNDVGNEGAIYITGSSPKLITGCTIYNNHAQFSEQSTTIKCVNAENVEICYNLIYSNSNEEDPENPVYSINLLNSGTTSHPVYVHNNTIDHNQCGIKNERTTNDEPKGYVKITNNVVKNLSYGISFSNFPSQRIQMSYNDIFHYSAGGTGIDVNGYIPNLSANPGMIYTDPQLSSDFRPIWNATTKSICIDAGDPDPYPLLHSDYLPWDEDTDHSRFDIGALTPWNTGHRNGLITLEKSEVWNWVSIPAIDYPNSSRYADNITNVFNNFRENDLFLSGNQYRTMEDLQWLYNTESGRVVWGLNSSLFYFSDPNHHVRSQYGYKIKLRQDAGPETKQIEFDGFQPGNPGNPITSLELMPPVAGANGCTVNPETGVLEREVWLGYFLDKSMNPFVALTSVLPHIVAIKSQEWCMERELVLNANNMLTYSDTWIGPMSAGHEGGFVINPGEMVAVRYIGTSDMQFHWGGENPEPPISPIFKREKAEHFVYNEKIDYLPIFAYLDLSGYEEGKAPAEIAIYVDGVCKGAEKIKGEEIQLKAYILDDPVLEGKTVEFKYWSPIKSGSQANPTYQVLDNHTGTYTTQFASLNHSGNYIKIKLDNPDADNPQLPMVTALMGNYPNPFNPDTIIRFSLVNESKVTLDVFNIKGQKVRTLVNETKAAGFYSSKWDGRDDNGNQVSSGVYFYRLNADKNSLTKKMILMK